jgi:hypothetical protein
MATGSGPELPTDPVLLPAAARRHICLLTENLREYA